MDFRSIRFWRQTCREMLNLYGSASIAYVFRRYQSIVLSLLQTMDIHVASDATISHMPDHKTDPDMENAGAALTRAGKRAKLLAAFTGTAYVVVRDGKLTSEIPNLEQVLKEQNAQEGWQIELLKHLPY